MATAPDFVNNGLRLMGSKDMIVRCRRRYLISPALIVASAVAGFVGVTSAAASEATQATKAWAAALKNLTPQQGETLLKIARDLFPNQELSDSNYTVCIDPYDVAAADPQVKADVQDALKTVEGASRRMANTPYVDISDDEERLRLAKMLADGRWMRGFKKSRLARVWKHSRK